MKIPWLSLPEVEQRAFRTAHEFLSGRLMEREVLEWALRLGVHRQAERIAVAEVFQNAEQGIREPWNSVWALLLESWEQTADPESADTDVFRVRTRIDRGDTSGQLIARVIDLVRPVIEIKPRSTYPGFDEQAPRRRLGKVSDLASVTISSGRLVDVDQLGLNNILDDEFLIELASGLDSALRSAFALGKRMGYEGDWRFELPNRVYNVPNVNGYGEDPDEFHRGIPPVVKLLYAVVERLGRKNISAAKAYANSWQASALPIHRRLWNAMARDPEFATPTEVETILSAASDENFWGMGRDSEISELRAARFSSLSPAAQSAIERRVRKGPPGRFWRKADKDRIKEIQQYWAVRELRRRQNGGGVLSESNDAWLAEQLMTTVELREMQTVDHDFRRGSRARQVYPNPDRRFDEISGIERLDALELELATTDGNWGDSSASDWIREGENSRSLLQDLEMAPEFGAAYPEVWNRFGWAFGPSTPAEGEGAEAAAAEGRRDADRVFGLLIGLPLTTVAKAMGGIAALLDQWRRVVTEADLFVPVWRRLWPVAVDVTNSRQSNKSGDEQAADQKAEAEDIERIDTLNNPAGKLYGVFIELCPTVRADERPFAANPELREMRDVMFASTGYAGLVVKYRMLEASEWFLAADPEWTAQNLFSPLQIDSRDNEILWGAIARRHHFKRVLSVIGMQMIDRAVDPKLSRDVRSALARSVVLEALHALNDERAPVIAFASTSQMVRSLEHEVRARVAGVIQKFAADMSKPDGAKGVPVEQIFNRSVRPFLEDVWPQEAMLATPGVAKALADLPITCGEAFVDAVNAISHFLVPFESWSMHDYGIICRGDGGNIGLINSPEKAAALLRLLDRTVGGADGIPVPYDLGEALEQVRNISTTLTELPSYRRLATLTRR